MSVTEMLRKAANAIENDDLNGAMTVAKDIIDMEPENPFGLELMGYILQELNCTVEAKFCFDKSIELNKGGSHVPHLYLGQLSNGICAVKHYLKAIEIMEANLDKENDQYIFKPTKTDISNAFVSITESYMTDLCDINEARYKAIEYTEKAIAADDKNPAAYQCMASYFLIINDKMKSTEYIKKSLDIWLPGALEILKENEDNDMDCAETNCNLLPELRTKCAEMLIELSMFDEMRSVLETVLFDDDEFFQAHYLMAVGTDLQLKNVESLSEEDTNELKQLSYAHADVAIPLADNELENTAVIELREIVKKYKSCVPEEAMEDDEDSESDEEPEINVDAYIYKQ